MAKTKSRTPLLLFLFLFLVASTEMETTEAKLCQRLSTTWHALCGSSSNCNRQCRNWEGARHGTCHARFPGFACFCYFSC